MIAMINKAKKVAAEKILAGDFGKAGFFIKVDEPRPTNEEIAIRATDFLATLKK